VATTLVSRIIGRAGITLAALVDAAKPRVHRRRALATRYRTPTSGALAAPVPQSFETTAASHDGKPTRIVATTSPGNQVSGNRPTSAPRNDDHLDDDHLASPGTLSIAEGSGHPGNQRSRPRSWVIVAFIAIGFAVAGIGLVAGAPWLFVTGVIAIVIGGLAGWTSHIMGDKAHRHSTGAGPGPEPR
jgi:hypothetical protein